MRLAERQNFVADCPNCGAVAAGHGQPRVFDEYVVDLTSCPACKMTLVMGAYFEQWGPTADHSEIGPWERLWPDPAPSLSASVPESIRAVFEEGQRCLAIHAHAAATTMARRTLEGIAHELGAKGKSPLATKLKKLSDEGSIPDELFEWSTALRGLGNAGAHYSDNAMTRQDAVDALAFAEAVAEYVFTFRQRYQEFQARTSTDENEGAT